MSRQLHQREHMRLRSAICERTGGSLMLQAPVLNETQATMLWRGLCRIFSPNEDRPSAQRQYLSAFEQAQFQRAISTQSGDRLACSAILLPVGQACRIWELVCAMRLPRTIKVETSSHRRAVSTAALFAGALPLAACATMLGGNVKGSFSCSAPGGTCAPSTVIDDGALALIQNARPMTPAARPWSQPPLRGDGKVIAVADGVAHREQRVLKVVFPAFVDQRGYLHEPRIVHAVADQGGWMQTAARSDMPALAEARLPAPPVGSNAGPAVATSQSALGLAGTDSLPDPAKVAAARVLGKARLPTMPMDIKAAVDARLSATHNQTAASMGEAVGETVTLNAEPATDQAGQQTAQQAVATSPVDKPVPINKPAVFAGPEE